MPLSTRTLADPPVLTALRRQADGRPYGGHGHEQRAGRRRCWLAPVLRRIALAVVLPSLVVSGGGCSKSAREARKAELAAVLDDLRIESERLCGRFEFDRAERVLAAFQEDLRAAGLEVSELADSVAEEVARVGEAKAAHAALLASGHVVFEGRVIETAERDKIVAAREEAARLEAEATAAREAALDRIADAAERGSDVNWRVRPQLQVRDYVEHATHAHDNAMSRLKSLIERADRGSPERAAWQRELDALKSNGPRPVYFAEPGDPDASTWTYEFGRLGYLKAPIVFGIPDTWKAVVTAGKRRVILARFATIHLKIGDPLPQPTSMFEVVGVETYPSPDGPERLVVLEPFSIGPYRSDMPASTIVE